MASIEEIMESQEQINKMEYENFLSPEAIEQLKKKENAEQINKILINAIKSRDIW